jgi:cation diffusion facilitator family transporter
MIDADRSKTRVAALSVASNTTLVALKVMVGLAMGSVSVISEAIHSGVDLLAAVIAFAAVKAAGKPADQEHPFGHGKMENISGTIEALLIFFAAGWIVFESAKKLSHQDPLESVGWGVGLMLLSAVVNFFVSRMLFKVGSETESVALLADAWHLRTDVYTYVGVMAGLALIWVGGLVAPGTDLRWIDPVAAIGVAVLIFKAAYDLTIESARDLLDVALTQEELTMIRGEISSLAPRARGYHALRTRKSGSERFAELHLLVDAGLSVDESHRIAEDATARLRGKFPKMRVTIHVEPCSGDCKPHCIRGCLLGEDDRRMIRERHGVAL